MTTKRVDVSGPGFSDDDSPPASNLSSMQRAIVTIQKMRTKLEALERARTEPIAIVGMACRIPGGANTPEAFYKLLEDGIDTVSEIPADRWHVEQDGPNSDGDARALRWGSFLTNIDRFDAAFFGISPREAESMDPQHRLLLEVTWEALERAGQLPERLMGTKTGVFVGIWAPDYQLRVLARDPNDLDAYCFTGTVLSTAAGRLSYILGVQGPCMAIDTACSSSLTAIHLACQSLRSGESTMAIAGGVNLMLAPSTTKLLSKTQALSPDGRCKTFDARANGYVRGEGCGMLVLKRLSDAERDGDSILALIRGSAVNQDGRSTGLTAPNVLSQQALLRQALESARLSPQDIAYLETHGTGTSLGDPIEVEAIKAVFGAPRDRGAMCTLGALKSNIGHLEAAAGVAGLIKAVLALQNEKIPGNLHFRSLNPRIDLGGTPLEIAQTAKPWTPGIRPRYAGISSFGISGTNAHVIIEEAPKNLEEALLDEDTATLLLPISAKTQDALRAHAAAFLDMLSADSSPRLLDIVYTASARRSHYVHRVSVVGRTKSELAEQLNAYLQAQGSTTVAEGKASPARAKIVFVFSGQGSQWLGMGRQLYESDASFRSVIDTCDNLMTSRLGWSILDELEAPETMSRMQETHVAQPLLFALQVALVEMLRSWGISPDAMIGHSVGEIAAAHIAGILSLDEAIRLVAIRGRIMQKATGLGKMVSVSMTPNDAQSILVGYEDRVSIAAINDPGTVVLSGAPQALDEIVSRCERKGVITRPLRVDYAFHSPQMDAFEHELVERLARVDTRRATLAMYSTVIADCVDGNELDVRYWGRNLRQTVDFAGAMFAAIRDGYQLFLEIGPHPVLTTNMQQCLAVKKTEGAVLFSMRRGRDQRQTLMEAVGALYTRGCLPEWTRLVPAGGKSAPLPTYPWQRERYWIDLPAASAPALTSSKRTHPVDEYCYALEWREQVQKPAMSPHHSSGDPFLVFMDDSNIGESVVRLLETQGHRCILVRNGTTFARENDNAFVMDLDKREDYLTLIRQIFVRGSSCAGVVYLFSSDTILPESSFDSSTIPALGQAFLRATYLIQAVAIGGGRHKPPIWLVTRGAVSTTSEAVSSPSHTAVWGLGRTVALEHAELVCKRIDLARHCSDGDVASLVHEFLDSDEEDQIAWRAGKRYVARIARTSMNAAKQIDFQLRSDATYIITGGLGGLGLSVAEWLAESGAKQIALLGRREPTEETRNTINDLQAKTGARLACFQADVASQSDLARVIQQMADTMPSVRGVIHAAGVPGESTPLLELRKEVFDQVSGPKLAGTWNLHVLTREMNLDFLVLYSSASAILGLIGQGGYAGSNAFLDGFSAWRNGNALPAMSIQWGAFGSVGMGHHQASQERRARSGMMTLDPAQGITALSQLLRQPRASIAVMNFSLRRWLETFPQLTGAPYFSTLRQTEQTSSTAQSADEVQILRKNIEGAPPQKREELLTIEMRAILGQVLKLAPERIGILEPFQTFGVDSLMSLEVRNVLETRLGIKLQSTLLFTYPNLGSLTKHLLSTMGWTTTIPSDSSHMEESKASELDDLSDVAGTELLDLLDAEMELARKGGPA